MKRYDSTTIKRRWDGKRVYGMTYYPEIQPNTNDAFVIAGEGDYLDTIAHKYYGDCSLWWIIALANNLGKGRLSIRAGKQLRIPANPNKIINQMTELNRRQQS